MIAVYERHGAAWARLRAVELIERYWLERFIALLGPSADVLDIGCGSGVPIAAALIERGFQVTGIDAAATMVDLFRRNFPDVPVYHADMRELAVGRRFDGLLAWDSFFHLSAQDQRPMFERLARHAAIGAPLMFTSGTEDGIAIGELEGEPLFHGSLATEEYRRSLNATGFTVVEHRERDVGCGGRTVWLARYQG